MKRKKSRTDVILGERANPFRLQHAEDVETDTPSQQDTSTMKRDKIITRRSDPLKHYHAERVIKRRHREAGEKLRELYQARREAKVVGGYTDLPGSGSVQSARVENIDWETKYLHTMRMVPAHAVKFIEAVCFDEQRVAKGDVLAMRHGLDCLAKGMGI